MFGRYFIHCSFIIFYEKLSTFQLKFCTYFLSYRLQEVILKREHTVKEVLHLKRYNKSGVLHLNIWSNNNSTFIADYFSIKKNYSSTFFWNLKIFTNAKRTGFDIFSIHLSCGFVNALLRKYFAFMFYTVYYVYRVFISIRPPMGILKLCK